MDLIERTWPEARDVLVRNPVGLVPIGAVEQHGPHLPLGTDWYIATHLASRAAGDGRLLLPGQPIGVSSEHMQFWGTLTLSEGLLRDQEIAVGRAAAAHGVRRLVFVNGHGSNCAALQSAAEALRREDIHVFVFNWWISIASVLADLFPDETAHAGAIETSAMLAIAPNLVRPGRFSSASARTQWADYVEGVQVTFDTISFSEEGNVGDPNLASVEKGHALLAAAVESLDCFCRWLEARSAEDLAIRPHKP